MLLKPDASCKNISNGKNEWAVTTLPKNNKKQAAGKEKKKNKKEKVGQVHIREFWKKGKFILSLVWHQNATKTHR